MNDKDTELVNQAKKVKGYNYAVLERLIEQCESEEAKSKIEYIMLRKYRKEEAHAGMI